MKISASGADGVFFIIMLIKKCLSLQGYLNCSHYLWFNKFKVEIFYSINDWWIIVFFFKENWELNGLNFVAVSEFY